MAELACVFDFVCSEVVQVVRFLHFVKYFRMSFRVSTFVGDKEVLRIY